jgi:hypothetical protein
MLTLILAAFLNDGSKPDNPDVVAMWVDDLGRLTPFGRTFDVYIQTGFDPEFSKPNGEPRPPYMIGSTRGNESPTRSFAWSVEGEVFKNRNDATYPFLENCPDCIEYWEGYTTFGEWAQADGTVVPCNLAGTYWDCIQSNPYQRWMYLGQNYTPVNWAVPPGTCCPNTFGLTGLEYLWCDSWILHGEPGRRYGQNQRLAYPSVQKQHADLIEPNTLKFWLPLPTGQFPSQVCCSSPSQNDYGDLIRWSEYQSDWSSLKHPGSFHIARFTGPDYFASGGVIRWACNQGYPCEPHPYLVSYYSDNACPSDLDEDGEVGYTDLLTVLSDVASYKYHPQTNNGYNALLKVLSEWGRCK